MLVLSRGAQEKVVFPKLGITVEVLKIAGNKIRLGIDAPQDVRVLRHELADWGDDEARPADDRAAVSTHDLRNRLNTASLALGLAEKQINAGRTESALKTLHRAIAGFDQIDQELKSGDRTAEHKRSNRVLLVDDDANEAELLAGYLEISGLNVTVAHDGVEAMLHLGRTGHPDVVLMDMQMPRMGGEEAVRAIRDTDALRDIRLFAVTGEAEESSTVPVGPAGVDRWLRKPIKPRVLVDSIVEELEGAVA